MTVALAPLARARPAEVDALLDAAFGIDRHLRTAYRIRAGSTAIDALSFGAFDGSGGDDCVGDGPGGDGTMSGDVIRCGVLVGSIQCWPVAVGDVPVVLVGPVAVAPDRQRAGIGRLLMTRLVDDAPDTPMAMIGDPEYYGRLFGFSAAATAGWDVPGPVERHRLLARNADGLPRRGMLGPRPFALCGIDA